MKNQSYFVPDFDGTQGYYENNSRWWDYWGQVTNGFFSWESAWPLRNGKGGKTPGDVSPDQTVIEGMKAHGKSYMIGTSVFEHHCDSPANAYRPIPNSVQECIWHQYLPTG